MLGQDGGVVLKDGVDLLHQEVDLLRLVCRHQSVVLADGRRGGEQMLELLDGELGGRHSCGQRRFAGFRRVRPFRGNST